MIIRQLYPGDDIMFMNFLKSLDRKTWENYGRWDYPQANITKSFKDIAFEQSRKRDLDEVGLILVDNGPYARPKPTIFGYSHLIFSNKLSRWHSCSFGVVIHQDYQKHGYGEWLLKDSLRFAKQIGKEKMWLHVYSFNKPAINLYKKLGFKEEGRFKKEEKKDGKLVDVISMAKFL